MFGRTKIICSIISDKCVFGDQPGHVARRGKTCHELITVEARHYECYNFQEECCGTCEGVKKLYVNGNQPGKFNRWP